MKRILTTLLSLMMFISLFSSTLTVSAEEATSTTVSTYSDLLSAIADARGTGHKTIYLEPNTYNVTGNEQLLLNVDGLSLIGIEEDGVLPTINCEAYLVYGQAGILVAASDVTIENINITNSTSATKPPLKVTGNDNGTEITAQQNIHLTNITVTNNAPATSAIVAHSITGLYLNGVKLYNTQATYNNGTQIKNNNYMGVAIAETTLYITNCEFHMAYTYAPPVGVIWSLNSYLYDDPSSIYITSPDTISCYYGNNTSSHGIVIFSERSKSITTNKDKIYVDGTQLSVGNIFNNYSAGLSGWRMKATLNGMVCTNDSALDPDDFN